MSRRPIPFATPKKRISAFAVDMGVAIGALTVPYCALGLPTVGSAKFWFLLIGAYSIVQFAGLIRPEYGFGRALVQIFVVSAHTFERLTPLQAITRAAARATFSLVGVAIADATSIQQLILVPLLIDILMLTSHPQKQTLADLMAGTVVVSMPPYMPHKAPAMPMYSADDSELGPPPKK